jgi:hypothetical protein
MPLNGSIRELKPNRPKLQKEVRKWIDEIETATRAGGK